MGINSWAVYGAGIVQWTQEKLANLDWQTRKFMSMNGGFHIRSNVARLYLPRKEGGRGLIRVAECCEKENRSLNDYLTESQERMLKAACEEKVCTETTESLGDYRERLYEGRVRVRKDKPLHGAFARDSEFLEMDAEWISGERNRGNDLCSAKTSPKNQLCQMPHR